MYIDSAKQPRIDIQEEDPGTSDVHALLLEHLADMQEYSPPDSVHALDMNALKASAITFWTVREKGTLLGCGALKRLDKQRAEIKSMKTVVAHLRKGVASELLKHIIVVATEQNLKYLMLETGSPDAFAPARSLYSQFGFVECGPFADYTKDPYSVFMEYEVVY